MKQGKELSLAALKVHRSAIVTIVDPLNRARLSQHHMVRRCLKTFLLSNLFGALHQF